MRHVEKIALLAAAGLAGVVTCFSDQIDAYVLQVSLMIGIYITLAVSLNLVTGYTGQFSLGHAGFMAVGAYTSAIITTIYGGHILEWAGGSSMLTVSVMLGCAMLAAGLMAALAGLIVGIPTLRLRGDYLAIATLGFGEIIRVLLQNWEFVGGAIGLSGIPSYSNIFWVYSVAALSIYVVANLVNSTYGRGFLATRDDEIAAEAMGVNTTRYKVAAFVFGAFFAGIAGALYAHTAGFIGPDKFSFLFSIEIVVIVILGGLGRTFGVVAAAILLTILNEALREVLRNFDMYRMIVYSLLLVVLMIVRPQGLLGNFNFTATLSRLFKRKPSKA